MTVRMPARVSPAPEMETTPAAALGAATELRAVTTSLKVTSEWADFGAASPAWQGEARESADHAQTRFARKVESAEAALERAATAADRLEDRLRRLEREREALEEDRIRLDDGIDQLWRDLDTAEADDEPVLQSRADGLAETSRVLQGRIEAWHRRVVDAEEDFVAALRSVDERDEGRDAATDPDRIDPDSLLSGLTLAGDDPGAVRRWWDGLTPAERQALIMDDPDLIGNTDGIPVRDRDEANRAALDRDLDYLGERDADGQLTEEEEGMLTNARAVQDALAEHREDIDPQTGDHLANLIGYRPGAHTGDGGVILSLGDPDRAHHVSTYVPGTTSEVSGIEGSMNSVEDLREAALDRDPTAPLSTILWLDYDAPSMDNTDLDELADIGTVITPGAAQRGGEDLADFIDGLRATDEGDPAHLSLIGHSYGATTAAHAAQDGADVDDLVLLGSPGAPSPSASGLTDGDVYVGAADHDPVSLLGRGGRNEWGATGPRPYIGTLGYDPAADSFGGHRFEVDPGSYRVEDLIANHSRYFQGESLSNIAGVVTDTDVDETGGRSAGYQTLPELIAGSSAVSGGEQLWHGAQGLAEHAGDALGDAWGATGGRVF